MSWLLWWGLARSLSEIDLHDSCLPSLPMSGSLSKKIRAQMARCFLSQFLASSGHKRYLPETLSLYLGMQMSRVPLEIMVGASDGG